jgi:two-component system, sensor histidine kinase and response regulator
MSRADKAYIRSSCGPPSPFQDRPSAVSTARILVVEDEVIVARDIRQQLVDLGYAPVGHATHGEQAVSMAEALLPDLVLMDVQLAGPMDGITAANLIRSRLALPVVFLTAFGGDDTLDRAKLTDPFGYILKPFSERELRTVLEIALYRHRTEARLRESEQRLRTLFESEPECVKVLGPGGELLEMNPAGLAMLEIDSVAEAVAHGLLNFVAPEHRVAFAALHQRVMAGARELLEFEIVGRRGTRRWLETHAAPMRDAAGRVTSLLGVTRDVTDRKQAAQALRDSNQRFRTLVEWTPEANVVHRDGRVVYANPAALRMFGAATLEQLVGHAIEALIHPDSREALLERVRKITAGLRITPLVEAKLLRLDGTVIDAEVQGTAIDYDGAPAVYAVMRDVTARKAAEAQLRKLSLAVEQSTQSILITDCQGRIEYVNQAFERITGYGSADALGRHPSFLGCDRHPEESIDGLWATLRSGQSWHGELMNRRADGSPYTALLTAVPLRQSDGRISNYLQLHDDISEQKRLAAELEQHRDHLEEQVASRTAELAVARQQAEAANQAKSTFLANMSHEIRTPMNAIIGINELLRRDAATPEQAQRLGQIAQASQHLLAIINDVLDLSKIEAGKVVLEDLPFQLSGVLDNVASIIGEAARRKGLAVEIDTDSMPLRLRGDPTRLRQALLNYAGNAVKFTARGKIVLRAHPLDDTADGLQVRFEVQDSGAGIAADVLPLLFTDFEQADTSTTRQHGGTGLGLAITRRLARMMGGEAGARSQLGVGSTFWFTVRLQRCRGQAVPAAQSESASVPAEAVDDATRLRQQHAGARVLLAEDNDINRQLALIWLEDLNLTVDMAVDGHEAVALAQAGKYDLVLMDMQMPQMDGLQATRTIRALPGWQATPILAMTANAFDDNRQLCEAAGMNDFVTKPVLLTALHAKLLAWLAPRKSPGEIA